MNEKQRQILREAQLEISKQALRIEGVKNENQDSFDNLPEGLQTGEKGEEMANAVTCLEEVLSNLEAVDAQLSRILNSFPLLFNGSSS